MNVHVPKLSAGFWIYLVIIILLSKPKILLAEYLNFKLGRCETNKVDTFDAYKQLCVDFGCVTSIQRAARSFRSCHTVKPKVNKKLKCAKDSYNGSTKTEALATDGGWKAVGTIEEFLSGPCTVEKISSSLLSQEKFLDDYAFTKPVVIYGASNNEVFKHLTKYDYLLDHYGNTTVKLSSANSFSYDRRHISFKEYCDSYLKPQSLKTLANETFYFFGDNSNENWFDLFAYYNYPPYFIPGHSAQLSFGVAGAGSGVPFHFHGPGFAETLWGRKRWFMYSPHLTPSFHPNRTTLQWLNEEYFKLKKDPHFTECTLNPGEFIYFPNQWWHATLNVDPSVFMSTFLSP